MSGRAGRRGVLAVLAGLLLASGTEPLRAESASAGSETALVFVVVGAPGLDEYGPKFEAWASRWIDAARQGGAEARRIDAGPEEGDSQRMQLEQALAGAAGASNVPLWLVLIGHGTFDQRSAKFNLVGPDVSADELSQWLAPVKRPVAIINCSSSSAPFLKPLSGPDRVVVTATRSGAEQNFAYFGDYLSQAIADPASDLDKDDQTSLLEAFLMASRRTEEYYKTEARLATEHALLDDNGDGAGTQADWFRGIRVVKQSADGRGVDGHRAHQWHLVPSDRERDMPADWRASRDRLELAVVALRDRKGDLPESDYYTQLEALLVELALLYEQADPTPAPEPAVGEVPPEAPGESQDEPPPPFPPEDP